MSIADRAARAFPPLACVRGYRYFASGRVALATRSDTELAAEVKGKRSHVVELRVDEGHLAAACTCAAKTCGPAACRHVWATLLEVDRQGVLDSLRGSQRVLALTALEPAPPKPSLRKRADAKEGKDVKTPDRGRPRRAKR